MSDKKLIENVTGAEWEFLEKWCHVQDFDTLEGGIENIDKEIQGWNEQIDVISGMDSEHPILVIKEKLLNKLKNYRQKNQVVDNIFLIDELTGAEWVLIKRYYSRDISRGVTLTDAIDMLNKYIYDSREADNKRVLSIKERVEKLQLIKDKLLKKSNS